MINKLKGRFVKELPFSYVKYDIISYYVLEEKNNDFNSRFDPPLWQACVV